MKHLNIRIGVVLAVLVAQMATSALQACCPGEGNDGTDRCVEKIQK